MDHQALNSDHKVLIVFNLDLFYNLAEKVCLPFAEGPEEKKWSVKVVTLAAARYIKSQRIELYVPRVNTYN
ncbi:hypothetical protein [Pareuzebyella sediminis]|uniref:hypothetical protein n=1 Tax=Pareuzebyella sediminis TaxID=2607998 RepID=UPI0011ECA91F|nr:hypothetical protein [Pareuzebyella sediminis]